LLLKDSHITVTFYLSCCRFSPILQCPTTHSCFGLCCNRSPHALPINQAVSFQLNRNVSENLQVCSRQQLQNMENCTYLKVINWARGLVCLCSI